MGENKCKNNQYEDTFSVSLFKITFLDIMKKKNMFCETLVITTGHQGSTEKF